MIRCSEKAISRAAVGGNGYGVRLEDSKRLRRDRVGTRRDGGIPKGTGVLEFVAVGGVLRVCPFRPAWRGARKEAGDDVADVADGEGPPQSVRCRAPLRRHRFPMLSKRWGRTCGFWPFLSGFLSLTPRAGKQITLGLTEGYKWRDGRDSNPFLVGRLSTT